MQVTGGFQVYQTKPRNMEITGLLPWRDHRVELIKVRERSLHVAFFESGVILEVDTYGFINFRVYVPSIYKTRTEGLLGNFDDNKTNEFHRRHGEQVMGVNTESEIFSHYNAHCK